MNVVFADLARCPCGLEQSYQACCKPLHDFVISAPEAQALMRSRFCAFCLKNVDYIVQTTVPSQQAQLDKKALQAWADNTDWTQLHIISHNKVGKHHAQVRFRAYFQDGAGKQCHDELSTFVNIAKKWYFLDPTVPCVLTNKQPCLCGSGNKFKQCCGKFLR